MLSRKKVLWSLVFVASACLVWILALVPLEIFFGFDMPWVEINTQEFTLLGFEIPAEKQLGIVLFSGVLMMLPARLVYLAGLKLSGGK